MVQNSAEAVTWAYRLLLDREPENAQAIESKLGIPTLRDLRLALLGSEEYTGKREDPQRTTQSPFFHYSSNFDAVAVMRRHAVPDLQPKPGYLVNFLGVAIDPKFFPTILSARAGEVEPLPVPANWHADIAEWGAALRAVDLSGDTFVMAELGCGWGCWMNNTGVAARRSGRNVKVIGIEGDGDHIQFAREALGTNGFTDDEIDLHRGVAAASSGVALFPRQDVGGMTWGSEPIFGASEAQRKQAVETGSHDEIPMLSLAELIGPYARVDLLHVDIQGGEADLVEQTLPLLNEKIAYILIGTHTKQIEGRLYAAFTEAGWNLEMERAAIFDIDSGKPRIRVDGVQAWRNPRLSAEQVPTAVA